MSTTRTIHEAATEDADLLAALQDLSIPSRKVARDFEFAKSTVNTWRSRHTSRLNTPPGKHRATASEDSDNEAVKGKISVTPDGAEVNNVVVTSPINKDWSGVFALFNLSADEFIVVDDTVRMSTWQQSKRLENGERDTVQLYSYSARFRRVTSQDVRPEHVAKWQRAIINDRPLVPTARMHSAPRRNTYLALVADPQLGKKGTAESIENWKSGFTRHMERVRELNPESIHVAFMGDEHEGVKNNYANQPHTVELNFTKQLELDFDMRVWTLRTAAESGIPVSASSVISNHGEWTRNDVKEVMTTRGDNSSTHISRQVKKFFDELKPFTGWGIDWTIGDGDPNVLVNLSGINAYFSHGYIEKGKGSSTEIKVRNAIERQILGKTDVLQNVPLYYTAHYHHFFMQEFEGRTQFGCPALEAKRSSEYMLDQYGVWSPPGMLGMLVGRDTERGWSNLAVY